MLAHYFVTDIEADGPDPLRHSMLSFATVVVREDGELAGEFEAVLAPRPDRTQDPRTMRWWQTLPEAWQAATTDPEPPERVMRRFCEWVEGYEGRRAFAARPILFDGMWIDHYLKTFAGCILLDAPLFGRTIFTAGALDIGTYIAGIFDRSDPHIVDNPFPEDWLGNHPHTHRAIDDARGYASLLSRLLRIAGRQPQHPDDFIAASRLP